MVGIDLWEEGAEKEQNRKEDPFPMEKKEIEGGGRGPETSLLSPSRDVCTRTSTAEPPVEWKWRNPYYFPLRLRGSFFSILEGNAWEDVLPQGIVEAAS
ncbi:hypothetical protein CEXT_603861 [Caerostris extrusa]|uniref:Uncharacterized protein n=1 Tax=Caerostris extrusa TaxID=172846 RepID=A0AAV4SVG7_CAEEX|nr:hypothetical protein CEXT_603861 [Caerostris extrusa]